MKVWLEELFRKSQIRATFAEGPQSNKLFKSPNLQDLRLAKLVCGPLTFVCNLKVAKFYDAGVVQLVFIVKLKP